MSITLRLFKSGESRQMIYPRLVVGETEVKWAEAGRAAEKGSQKFQIQERVLVTNNAKRQVSPDGLVDLKEFLIKDCKDTSLPSSPH